MKSELENSHILQKADSLICRLLLVEDDPVAQDVTKLFLKNTCEVEIAKDGYEALQKVNSSRYDAILMDINLGSGMNGIESVKKIREVAGYETTPIVALTAYAMKGDKENFLAAGCTHYLSKPFDKKSLIELIKQIFFGDDLQEFV